MLAEKTRWKRGCNPAAPQDSFAYASVLCGAWGRQLQACHMKSVERAHPGRGARPFAKPLDNGRSCQLLGHAANRCICVQQADSANAPV